MMKLGEAGISVYQGNSLLNVKGNLDMIKEGKLILFDINKTCLHHH